MRRAILERSLLGLIGLSIALSISSARVAEATEDPDAASQPEDVPEARFRIDAIEVQGLWRTERFVVERELLFSEGDVATRSQIDESVQRLRNLGLFRVAEYELVEMAVPLPEGAVGAPADTESMPGRVLRITVDERWTLLPQFAFGGGGGLFFLAVGLNDINVLGRYIEAGVQYSRLAETNSYAMWVNNPRLFDLRLSGGIGGSFSNRIRVLRTADGEIDGGYFQQSLALSVGVLREFAWWLRGGLSVGFVDRSYSYDLIPDSIIEAQTASEEGGLPDDHQLVDLSASLGIGRINSLSYLRTGERLSLKLSHAEPALGSTYRFSAVATEFKAFRLLPWKINIGGRTGLAVTNADQVQNQYFLGGFGRVRGFLDSQFRGTHAWYGNAEIRVPSIDTRWFVLQHIFFVDGAAANQRPSQLFNLSAASAGVGFRIISPKVYRFVMRVDYAFPLHRHTPAPLSFGGQQYF